MNISLNHFSHHAVSFLRERILPSLTARQKKILTITSIAIGCLAICYAICYVACSLWFNGNPFNDTHQIQNGKGKKTFPDGEVWAGEFKNGMLNGQGKKIINREIVFGHGIFKVFGRGTVFEGEFENCLLNGQGKITYLDGHVEEGEFKDDYLNGQGKIIYSDANQRIGIKVSEGEFTNGWLNGTGQRTYFNGRMEIGEFKNNVLDKGKISFSNGEIFEKEESIKHGFKGKKIFPDGKEEEGTFIFGQLTQGKITYPDGRIEKGIFEHGILIEPQD